jgi:hypothetical protein
VKKYYSIISEIIEMCTAMPSCEACPFYQTTRGGTLHTGCYFTHYEPHSWRDWEVEGAVYEYRDEQEELRIYGKERSKKYEV